MNILAGMTTQNRRGRTRLTASEYEYDIIRAISNAIGSKYGELDIITHSDNSGGRDPYPEVSFTLVGGEGGSYRVTLTAKKKGRKILFEVVGGYESAPSSRYKTLYKVDMGNPMWLSGEYLADELVGWADDKKLWKDGKIQRDFKNLRWRLVEECEYLLEDGEDLEASAKPRLRASDDFYQSVARELKTSVDPKKFKLKLSTPDVIKAVADKADGDVGMLRGHIFFELSHPNLSTPIPMGAFFKDYEVGAAVCAEELERFAYAQTFARHTKNLHEAVSILVNNLDLYKRLDSNGVKAIKALLLGLQYVK